MKSEQLSNTLLNVIKALKLIEKDSTEVYLHFHVINGKSLEISFFVIFQFLTLWENKIEKRKSKFFQSPTPHNAKTPHV